MTVTSHYKDSVMARTGYIIAGPSENYNEAPGSKIMQNIKMMIVEHSNTHKPILSIGACVTTQGV